MEEGWDGGAAGSKKAGEAYHLATGDCQMGLSLQMTFFCSRHLCTHLTSFAEGVTAAAHQTPHCTHLAQLISPFPLPVHSPSGRRGGGGGEGEGGEGDAGGDDDDEVASRWNLRRCSAAALDRLSLVYGDELLPLLLPIVEQRLQVVGELGMGGWEMEG